MTWKSVEITGIKTNNINVLSDEETKNLFIKMQNGDLGARNELIKGNLKLVLSIIQKFIGRNDNMDDLFQIGVIGLIKAIDNFDLSYNLKLSTYAVPLIMGEIRRYLRDKNMLRISRSLKDLAYKSMQMQEKLTNEYGRTATYEEIAFNLGVDVNDVMLSLEAMWEPSSIFEPIYEDGGDTIFLYEQLEDKKVKDVNDNLSINDAINKLNQRERNILNNRYIIGKTQVEIANELNLSQAQVSRLEKDAIKTLKKVLR